MKHISSKLILSIGLTSLLAGCAPNPSKHDVTARADAQPSTMPMDSNTNMQMFVFDKPSSTPSASMERNGYLVEFTREINKEAENNRSILIYSK